MNKIKSISIFSTPATQEQVKQIFSLYEKLCQHNYSVSFSEITAKHIEEIEKITPPIQTNIDLETIDAVISIGGDGTVLNCVKYISNTNKPIICINNGRLGFLADIKIQDLDSILLLLKGGVYNIEKRGSLSASYSKHKEKLYALNEIAIQKGGKGSLLTIHAYIDDEYLSAFWADGIIIATPTGSTAYSLSIGGPIMTPWSESVILNPIAPHTLTVRPIIIPAASKIKLKVSGRDNYFIISNDSNQISFNKELEITIIKADYSANFIKFGTNNYYSTLREKLMWGADIRN